MIGMVGIDIPVGGPIARAPVGSGIFDGGFQRGGGFQPPILGIPIVPPGGGTPIGGGGGVVLQPGTNVEPGGVIGPRGDAVPGAPAPGGVPRNPNPEPGAANGGGLSSVPTWVWVAGGAVAVGGIWYMMRRK